MLESSPRPRDDADAKAWFYLDRRRDIEEWAGLRSDAAGLFDRYLLDLAEDFESLAVEFGVEYVPQLDDGFKFRWLGLRRASWKGAGLETATIGLQWYPDKLFQHYGDNWPFLGVYLEPQGRDDQRRRVLADALADVRSALDGKTGKNWLFWRYVRPADGARSVDPDGLARSSLRQFRDLWAAAAPVLDAYKSFQAPDTAPGSDQGELPAT